MANEWVGVIQTTAPKYTKGASDLTMRERLWLALIQQKGRFKASEAFRQLFWNVEYAQPPVEAFGDGGTLNYTRHDLYRQANIDVRGYKATDMMTRKEMGMNAGDVAIIKRYDKIMPNLLKAIKDKMGAELYIDGYGAGNDNRLHGINSFTGVGTVAAGDRIAEPSDTYAGRSTALGQGGTWTSALTTKPNSTVATDWPDGSGDSEYDYFSPKLINWSSTNWGTGSTTWLANCEYVIRKANQWMTLTGGQEGRVDLMMLAGNLFYDYQNHWAAKQRLIVPWKPAEDLGFVGTMTQEGIGLYQEFDCPANTGFGLNFDQLELCSLFGDLFHSQGPDYDPKTDAWLFHVGFFGNLRFESPKYFCKLYNYA